MLTNVTRFSALKRWGMDVAKRRGTTRAKVALARKIGIIQNRMLIDGKDILLDEGGENRGRMICSSMT
jgi:transposase